MNDYLPEIKELVAQRRKWRSIIPMSIEVLHEPWATTWLADQIIVSVEIHLLSREVRTEVEYTMDVPTSWVQHLKLAILPSWLARRFPPRVNVVPITTKHYHNCPHIDVPRNERRHYFWLANLEGRDG